jgi:hypothetical protein
MNLLCSNSTVNDALVYCEAIAWPGAGGVEKIDGVKDWNEAARELVVFFSRGFCTATTS